VRPLDFIWPRVGARRVERKLPLTVQRTPLPSAQLRAGVSAIQLELIDQRGHATSKQCKGFAKPFPDGTTEASAVTRSGRAQASGRCPLRALRSLRSNVVFVFGVVCGLRLRTRTSHRAAARASVFSCC
jgi:hypothetical protein